MAKKLSQGAKRRRRMLEILSRNLALYMPHHGRAFLCPLCHTVEPFSAPEDIDDRLSIAHILPAAAGGNTVTLTCARCNNEVGRKYDRHLAQALGWSEWSLGKRPLDARIKVGQASMGVEWRKTDSGMNFNVIPKQTHPQHQQEIMDQIAAGNDMQVQVDLPVPRRKRMSLLHSGFLALFRHFGYEFALSPSAKHLRRIILDETTDHPVLQKAVPTLSVDVGVPLRSGEVYILTFPKEIRAFVVPFRHPHKDICWGVLLPGFGEQEWGHYVSMCQQPSEGLQIKGVPLGEPEDERLVDPLGKWYGHEAWHWFYIAGLSAN